MIAAAFYTPRCEDIDYVPLLELQRRSCQRFGIRHVVIGDREIPGFDTFVTRLPESLMQASLVAQGNYLAQHEGGDLILCDADGVFTSDPREVFDGSFDVAVTVHPFLDSILNNGAMFIADATKAAPFWDDALGRVEGDVWGDDQAALRDAFEATLDLGVTDRRGVRVKFLPCVGYNEAPEWVGHGIMPVFAHFRGGRKEWMGEWSRQFLNL